MLPGSFTTEERDRIWRACYKLDLGQGGHSTDDETTINAAFPVSWPDKEWGYSGAKDRWWL